MLRLFIAILLAHSIIGCSGGAERNRNTAETEIRFFPVTSFIKAQISGLDTLQVNPMHLVTSNGKTDTIWMQQPAEAKNILKPFTEHAINDTNLCRYFNESNFNDLTLDAVTFTYDPKQNVDAAAATPIVHWDVYVNNATGKIKRIYVVKRFLADRGATEQQLTWVADKWAKITTLKNDGSGRYQAVREEKIVWNFNE
jgi:hypothetical protein